MTTLTGKRSAILLTLLALVMIMQSNFLDALAKMPTATIGTHVVKLEVASTEEEIQKGLMKRSSLEKDQGMVFLFKPPRPVRFWMFNCLISLDMLFIKDGKIVKICHDVPPCRSPNPTDCPTYPADGDVNVSEVIEVNAGYCKRNDIKEGDSVKFDF